MTNDEGSPNDQMMKGERTVLSSFGFRHPLVIRHSSFSPPSLIHLRFSLHRASTPCRESSVPAPCRASVEQEPQTFLPPVNPSADSSRGPLDNRLALSIAGHPQDQRAQCSRPRRDITRSVPHCVGPLCSPKISKSSDR